MKSIKYTKLLRNSKANGIFKDFIPARMQIHPIVVKRVIVQWEIWKREKEREREGKKFSDDIKYNMKTDGYLALRYEGGQNYSQSTLSQMKNH